MTIVVQNNGTSRVSETGIWACNGYTQIISMKSQDEFPRLFELSKEVFQISATHILYLIPFITRKMEHNQGHTFDKYPDMLFIHIQHE